MRDCLTKTITWWTVASGFILLAIVMVTTINAVAFALDKLARLAGGSVSGLPGYEDFVGLAIGCAALMFMPYCQLKRGHIFVELFVRPFPRKFRKVLDLCSLVLLASITLFLAYWMVMGMLETRADYAVSRVLGWPEWYFYSPGIVSLLLWAMVVFEQIVNPEPDG